MQREEFLQQLWLDYIHQHPELGGLHAGLHIGNADYLVLLTLTPGAFGVDSLQPALQRFGYHFQGRYALADRGVLITRLAPPDGGAWLLLTEFQSGALSPLWRDRLQQLIDAAPAQQRRGQNLLCRGRPWPMPDWHTYQALAREHPIAAWLAVMGPRLHHAGFDCGHLNDELDVLDRRLQRSGLAAGPSLDGIFPVSPLLERRFYAACSRRLAFAAGDEHRIATGGITLVQRKLAGSCERAVELLLPHHARCEVA